MIPIDLSQKCDLPIGLREWEKVVDHVTKHLPIKSGTAYVTIDEREIPGGATHRRPGAHVDGNYFGPQNGWGGGGWHRNDHTGGVMLLASSAGAVAWEGEVSDDPTPWNNEGSADGPSDGGDCEHMRRELASLDKTELKSNVLYWMNSGGIHESIPVKSNTKRSLLRITLPPDYPQLALAA